MPLFRKSACLPGLGLALALSLGGPAQALDARLKQRTPFCQQAAKGCAALFYLSPGDQVQVLRQSADSKWLYVRYRNQHTGWIQSDTANLKKPEGLRADPLKPLPAGALALLPAGDELRILFADAVQTGTRRQPVVGLHSLLTHPQALHLDRCAGNAADVCVYGVQTTEEQSFVLQLTPDNPPHYRTLLRLRQPEGLQGLAVKAAGLLLLGEAEGVWGESLLLGLGADGLPFLLLKQAQEALVWVPQDVRSGLNLESVRLMHLNRDGVLLASAFHLGQRRHVLLRLRFDPERFWVYEGLMRWPDAVALSPREAGVQVQGLGAEGDFYVLIAAEGKTWLAYYSGSQEPLAVQTLAQRPLDAQLAGKTLWLLHPEGLRAFKPHFSP
ncbi:MAG: hypothetical protein IGS03_03010 [Candidatus Sericytochromatia bacterium]|nr:hypothetical protein [Candidatus Sericytochromatia bacterium]